jgi:chromate transport protein ChrA
LALYLTFAIAAVADDRVVEYLVAGLAAAAAVICGGAATLFSLDALQMKGQVSAAAASQYDIGSMWVVARLLVVAVLFIVLAASSMRTARSAPHKPSAVFGRGGGQVLIRTTPPGTTAQRGVDVEGG